MYVLGPTITSTAATSTCADDVSWNPKAVRPCYASQGLVTLKDEKESVLFGALTMLGINYCWHKHDTCVWTPSSVLNQFWMGSPRYLGSAG